jgi:DNA-binding transcriptional ArsR family regulator
MGGNGSRDDEKIVRFESEVEQAGFTIIENVLLIDGTLSMGAKIVLLLLKHYAWQGDVAWPGQERLAWQAGCTQPTLRKHMAELADRGLVVQKRQGQGRTNLYRLVSPAILNERNLRSGAVDSFGEVEAVEEDTENPSSPPTSEMASPRQTVASAAERATSQANVKGSTEGEGRGSRRDLPAEVWAVYVEEMGPRQKSLLPQERAVIREALKVASVDECIDAIRGCKASAFHMGDNDGHKKYNRLTQILRGKRGGKTTREQIDLMRGYLDKASQIPSEASGEINRAKERVRLGMTHPTHDYHRTEGEKAQAFLAEYGITAEGIEYEVAPGVTGLRVVFSGP